jgi:hypothetical protein
MAASVRRLSVLDQAPIAQGSTGPPLCVVAKMQH